MPYLVRNAHVQGGRTQGTYRGAGGPNRHGRTLRSRRTRGSGIASTRGAERRPHRSHGVTCKGHDPATIRFLAFGPGLEGDTTRGLDAGVVGTGLVREVAGRCARNEQHGDEVVAASPSHQRRLLDLSGAFRPRSQRIAMSSPTPQPGPNAAPRVSGKSKGGPILC